jgi:hypothetical protein
LQFLNDWLATGHGRFTGCDVHGVQSLRDDPARFTFLPGETDGEGLITLRTVELSRTGRDSGPDVRDPR